MSSVFDLRRIRGFFVFYYSIVYSPKARFKTVIGNFKTIINISQDIFCWEGEQIIRTGFTMI